MLYSREVEFYLVLAHDEASVGVLRVMFIKSSDAHSRLSSSKNRLSRGEDEAPASVSDPLRDESQLEEFDDDEEEEEDELDDLITLPQIKAELDAHQQELVDFKRLDELISGDFDDRVGRGRGKRRYRNNEESQAAIGEVAALTTQQTAADLFGISQAQTHAYDNSSSSSNHVSRGEYKPGLKAKLDRFKELLAAKAAIRLHETLDVLDGDKLRSVKKATNLSRIAKDMATVMRNVEERLDRSGPESVHYHVWKPEMKSESSYETVEATVVRSGDGADFPSASKE